MQYQRLGKTGLDVSKLSLGVASFGGAYGPVDEHDCKACVEQALSLGINYFDTSPYYGSTRSEAILGRCLAGIPRDKFFLATKVGRYGDTFNDFDFSAKRVRQSIDESLLRLGVDYVDVILCHDVEFGSLDQIVEEALPTLRDLVKQGKARYVGISGYPLKIFREVLGRTELDVVLSYCHNTLNDRTLDSLMPRLVEHGVGIINASPFSMGLLTEWGPPAWHPAPPSVRESCRSAVELCRSRGERLEKLALQLATRNPAIDTTLVGTFRPSELAENVRWLTEELDENLFIEVQRVLAPIQGLTWMSGRPENND